MNSLLTEKDMITIQDVLMEELDVTRSQITPESTITGDLGADSLAVAEICMHLEDRFNLVIPDEILDQIRTVGDLYEAVDRLLEKARRHL